MPTGKPGARIFRHRRDRRSDRKQKRSGGSLRRHTRAFSTFLFSPMPSNARCERCRRGHSRESCRDLDRNLARIAGSSPGYPEPRYLSAPEAGSPDNRCTPLRLDNCDPSQRIQMDSARKTLLRASCSGLALLASPDLLETCFSPGCVRQECRRLRIETDFRPQAQAVWRKWEIPASHCAPQSK